MNEEEKTKQKQKTCVQNTNERIVVAQQRLLSPMHIFIYY